MSDYIRPDELRIAGMNWSVTVVPAHNGLLPHARGSTDWEECSICLADCNDNALQKRTMLHELVHVADMQGDLGLTEVQVSVITNNLWAILMDNPALILYLFQGE